MLIIIIIKKKLKIKKIKNKYLVYQLHLHNHVQAATKDNKNRICCRAYNILCNPSYGINFSPEDIILDPNILTICTGIAEHNTYGIDFINATNDIRKLCPYSHISGGLSNLSFAFRGVNKLRSAMHPVFLYYAIQNGMDFGIVDAGKIPLFDDIESDLRYV